MDNPCRNCEDRHMLCHSECSRYKEWRESLPKKKRRDDVDLFFIEKSDRLKRIVGRK